MKNILLALLLASAAILASTASHKNRSVLDRGLPLATHSRAASHDCCDDPPPPQCPPLDPSFCPAPPPAGLHN